MSKDTIVGVVGAIVLVAVMVAVFAYEYNTADAAAPEPGSEAAKLAQFNARYGELKLKATDDLDNDGTDNLNDTDLDQDGTLNAEDTHVAYVDHVEENMPPSTTTNTQRAYPFAVTKGAKSWTVSFHYDAFLPLSQVRLPAIELRVEGSDPGAPAQSCTSTQSGATVSCEIHVEGSAIETGTFLAVVTETTTGPQTMIFLDINVEYGDVPAAA